MSISIQCLQCGKELSVNQSLAGRRVRCPDCDTAIVVPAEMEDVIAKERADEKSSETSSGTSSKSSVKKGRSQAEDEVKALSSEPELDVTQELVIPHAVAVEPKVIEPGVPTAGPAVEPQAVVPTEAVEDDDEDDEVLPRGKRPEEEMDMTPMVDVTFLLLIFFMVTAAFSLQKSIRMPRQQTDAPSINTEEEEDPKEQVELQIDEYGSFLVMAPEWEREVPGKQNLVSALREAITGNTDGMDLVIKVHEMAKLNALVDAMDAGTIAGYASLQVTQVDGFD
ncbi:MAG: biopolymer transporter ExbD [Planctomycetota bacterium]